jgi:excisionase family DNA binding protein
MRLVTPQELAEALQVPVGTIYRWNYRGTGPPPLHVGRHVRYRAEDVETWLKSMEVREEALVGAAAGSREPSR